MIKGLGYEKVMHYFTADEQALNMANPSTTLFHAYMYQAYHQKYGIHLIADKVLTDELSIVDCHKLGYDDIVWPAKSVEISFQDDIPAILIVNLNQDYRIMLASYFHKVGASIDKVEKIYNDVDGIGMIMIDNAFAVLLQFCNTEQVNKVLCGERLKPLFEFFPDMNPEISDEEVTTFREMLGLTIKILLYISLAEVKTKYFVRQKLRKYLKIPKVQKNISVPVRKIINLPSVNFFNNHKSTGTGEQVAPHFRRGHMRRLNAERYKNKGIVYVRPCLIHGGNTEAKVKYAASLHNISG
jgi:hypothetical protein